MNTRQHGFTLIEVLVALTIIAVSLGAIMTVIYQATDSTEVLRDRNFAIWVAENRIAEHRVLQNWPTIDTNEGKVEMAGRNWRWREKVEATPNENFRRIVVDVSEADSDYILFTLVAIIRRPEAPVITPTAPST